MTRIVRTISAAALVLGTMLPAAAQTNNTPAPGGVSLGETIDIRVINVDVVVTDRRGNVVTGLKKEDFELLENGVPKTISNFYEVEGSRATTNDPAQPAVTAAATAAAPATAAEPIPENLRRRVIFYIDNLSLAPFNRNRVFKQMKEFINETLRPGDEAMIATYNRSMKVRTPFTRDVGLLHQTLDTIAGESAMGTSNVNERRQAETQIKDARSYEEAIAAARQYAASVEHDLRQSASSLTALMSTLAGVEGKKILVLTSEGFPIQPGRELFFYIDEVSREKQWSTGSSMIEGMNYSSATLIQNIAKAANANGITLYPIHAAGLTAGSEFSAEHARPSSSTVSRSEFTNSNESLQLMAQMTGGIATSQTNNFAEAFKKIRRDLDSYYSLGYRAGTQRVDRQRYLQVRMKQKGLIVRNRQTFVEKSPFAEMSDRVVANLLYKSKANDLKIAARIGTPVGVEGGLYRVSIDVQVPIDNLTLLPQGDEFAGSFDVYVAVANKLNDMSDVARKTAPVRISAAEMERAKGKVYTYTLDLLMERGLNRVSIGVVDNVSYVNGFIKDQVLAQDLR